MWSDVSETGLPTMSGNYICVVRGKTDIYLMKFLADKKIWTSRQGQTSQNVTHWFLLPEVPPSIRENMLLRKAIESGLDDNEKLELSSILIRKKSSSNNKE